MTPWLAVAAALAALAAGPRTPELSRAQGMIERGDYEEALKTLGNRLDRGSDLSEDELVEVYRLLGLAHLSLGNEVEAQQAYRQLLQARPDFRLPRETPPKLQRLYERILEEIRLGRVRPVSIQLEPLPDAPAGEVVSTRIRVEDLPLGSKVRLYFRRAGAEAFSAVDFARKGAGAYEALIPGYAMPPEPGEYELEYYVEVADPTQRRLAGRGDAFNPFSFKVLPQRPGATAPARAEAPWYQNPYVWAGGGAVAVAAGAGVLIAVTQKQRGSVTIVIQTGAWAW
jgi:tetratricopeptide (TPR) repeat protein